MRSHYLFHIYLLYLNERWNPTWFHRKIISLTSIILLLEKVMTWFDLALYVFFYWTTLLLDKVMGQYCCLTNPKWGNLTIKYKHKCRGSHKTIKLGQYSSLWGFWNLVYNRLTPILNVKDLKFLVASAKFLAGVYNNSTESVQSKLGCWQPAIPTNIPHERQSFSIWRQWKWWSHEKIQMKLMIGRENLVVKDLFFICCINYHAEENWLHNHNQPKLIVTKDIMSALLEGSLSTSWSHRRLA